MPSRRKIFFLCMLAVWPLLLVLYPVSLRADVNSLEYQLKAAFLLNFAKFITWPDEAFSEELPAFVLCIVGRDPFAAALEGVENKRIGGRPVQVVYAPSMAEIPSCHLLFLSRSEQAHLGQLTTGLGGRATLTVSDIAGFIQAGGHIEFVVKDHRLAFMINHSAMKGQGLHAGASLLNLAAVVK